MAEAEGDRCDYVRYIRNCDLTHHVYVVYRTSTKVERIQDYLAVADAPELTSEDIKAIDEAGSQETRRHFVRLVLSFDDMSLIGAIDDFLAVGGRRTVRTRLHARNSRFLNQVDNIHHELPRFLSRYLSCMFFRAAIIH